MCLNLKLRIRLASGLVAACIALAIPQSSRSDVIFSDLGPPLIGAGTIVSGAAAAAEYMLAAKAQNAGQIFTPSGDAYITGVTVAASFPSAQPGFMSVAGPNAIFSPNFNEYLYSDYEYTQYDDGQFYAYHEPNAPIAELAANLTAPNDPGLISTTTINKPLLTAGTFYWVLLTPADPYTYIAWDVSDNSPEALEVDGTLSQSAAPEPSTFALGALLCLATPLCSALRRKKRQALSI